MTLVLKFCNNMRYGCLTFVKHHSLGSWHLKVKFHLWSDTFCSNYASNASNYLTWSRTSFVNISVPSPGCHHFLMAVGLSEGVCFYFSWLDPWPSFSRIFCSLLAYLELFPYFSPFIKWLLSQSSISFLFSVFLSLSVFSPLPLSLSVSRCAVC